MKAVNAIVEKIPRSGIRLILDEANQYKDVIHLEIGQPNFQTPPHIIQAAHQAALEGFTGYTPNAGLSSVRDAFSERLALDHKINRSPDQIIVSVGAMGALFDTFGVLVSSGDEVLVPDPGYPNYQMALEFLGARPVPYQLGISSDGFFIDPDAIKSNITKKTKAIVINSPSNPTGLVADEETICQIAEIAMRTGVFIISDEAYDHIIFEGSHISPLNYAPDDQVISVYSCSKTYAMTGWRVGFVVAPSCICPLFSKLQEICVSCAPSISQKAAQAALEGPQTCVEEMRLAYKKNCEMTISMCENY